MAAKFWVGGSGTWDAATTTNWSDTSGGAGGAAVPGASDTVTFDANSGTGTVTMTDGTNPTVQSVSRTGTLTRTLTLGNNTITCTLAGTAWNFATVTNLTVTANTATVTLSGAAATFNSGAVNWNGMSVVMSGSGGQSVTAGGGAFTVANFTRTGTAVKTDSLSCQPFTVTGTLTLTGNSATNRLLFCSTVLGTARTITAAAVSLTNVDFRDITGAGAATWSGTSIGNALGNTGITFTTPVTRYAVATGNVSGTGTWSDTSGGASGASVPLCHDTIILNAASGAITVTNDMPRLCADLTCTGFTGTLATGIAAEIYGSVAFGSGMTFSGTNGWSFMGRSSHTITSAGKTWTNSRTLTAIGGTYTHADAATQSGTSGVTVTNGTLNDGGFTITTDFLVVGTGATWTATGTWNIYRATAATPVNINSGATINASAATIVLTANRAADLIFAGGGKTYGTLTDQSTGAGALTITGANTFGTINKTATVACTLALPTSSGCTFTTFAVTGISGAVLTLTGDVTKAEGTVSCDYLAISSSDAAGGALFYAGANSSDGGTNTGWIFGAPTGGRPYKGGTATVKESDIEGALVIL